MRVFVSFPNNRLSESQPRTLFVFYVYVLTQKCHHHHGYRNKEHDEHIRFGTVRCALGLS